MKIRVGDRVCEGTGAEIMDQLRLALPDADEFPTVESYVRFVAANFTRTTGLAVVLPETNVEEQARTMLLRLAYAGGLELLDGG